VTWALDIEQGHLSQLTGLDLHSNQLSGPIPDSLGQLTQLTALYLGTNQLSGPIPDSLGRLTQLTVLDLYSNQLSGPIPDSLGQLTQLTVLDLGTNQLSGPIPDSLGRLTQLTGLYLGTNQLSGPIPDWLGQLQQLTGLDLGTNQLSGPIPDSLGQLTQLTGLDLHTNQLRGPIPDSLGQLTQLTLLDLDTNQLSGPIPDSLGRLPSLVNLLVQRNMLTGPMPPLPHSLRVLVAFDNDFTHLPPLQPLHNLTFLVLDGNRRMTGQLHGDWSAFTKLRVLSAQHCSLSGELPPGLLRLSLGGQLRSIRLRDNLLRGAIQLTGGRNASRVSSLTDIDVSQNEIGGRVPTEMYEYVALAPELSVLRLEQNLLSCGLDGLRDTRSSNLSADGGVSILSGNAFQCPVPGSIAAEDPAAESYTCDSAPWQLDLMAAAAASLFVVAVEAACNWRHMSARGCTKGVCALRSKVRVIQGYCFGLRFALCCCTGGCCTLRCMSAQGACGGQARITVAEAAHCCASVLRC